MIDDIFPFIVADVGGTNARYGLVSSCDKVTGAASICHQRVFPSSKFDDFASSLESYLVELGDERPKRACLAIAGPSDGDRIHFTNRPDWSCSSSELKRRCRLDDLHVVNDFAALACALPFLKPADLYLFRPGRERPTDTRAIIGPGTGLGVAGLMRSNDRWLALRGEGGHVGLAPSTDLEFELWNVLRQWLPRVSAEAVLSGPGLVNLHRAMSMVLGHSYELLEPNEITRRGMDDSDPACRETLRSFCALLGGFAGDTVLTYGARGGLYLGGGILPQLVGFLAESEFSDRFAAKGIMAQYVADVPVYLIKAELPALTGAAAWLTQKLRPAAG